MTAEQMVQTCQYSPELAARCIELTFRMVLPQGSICMNESEEVTTSDNLKKVVAMPKRNSVSGRSPCVCIRPAPNSHALGVFVQC